MLTTARMRYGFLLVENNGFSLPTKNLMGDFLARGFVNDAALQGTQPVYLL